MRFYIFYTRRRLTTQGETRMTEDIRYILEGVDAVRKPSNIEWIEWGINNDIDHGLVGVIKGAHKSIASASHLTPL